MLPTGWLSLPAPTFLASTTAVSGEARLGLLVMPGVVLLLQSTDEECCDWTQIPWTSSVGRPSGICDHARDQHAGAFSQRIGTTTHELAMLAMLAT